MNRCHTDSYGAMRRRENVQSPALSLFSYRLQMQRSVSCGIFLLDTLIICNVSVIQERASVMGV